MTATYLRDEDNGFELVTLGGNDTGLQLQRAFDFDEQDVALGMDTYCLVAAGTGASFYGGIATLDVAGATARLVFTPEAREVLGIPPDLSVEVDEAVAEALRRMVV